MRNIKLTIEYDGTNYVGWQTQPNGPSIQETLEKGLGRLLQEEVRLIGAGRTDSGVHARGQVANFKTEHQIPGESLRRGLNALIPEDIVIHSVDEVSEDFHARYSAKTRSYRYVLALKETALERNRTWYVGGYRLDHSLLTSCAGTIMGDHDFSSFSKVDEERGNFLCTIHSATWREEGANLLFEISANRFLHGMVRSLVGTMVEVGRGYRTLDDFEEILQARDRRRGGMAAPAKGLFLEKVTY